jgi:hypothetical protein
MATLPRCFLTDECRGDPGCEHLFKCREAVLAHRKVKVARESLESNQEVVRTGITEGTAQPSGEATDTTEAAYRSNTAYRRALDRRAHAASATRGTPFERGGLRAHQAAVRPRVGELETGTHPDA